MAYPELPTMHEAGMPNFDPVTWTGICAPKGVPAAVVARVQADVAKVLAQAEITRKLARNGLTRWAARPSASRSFSSLTNRGGDG